MNTIKRNSIFEIIIKKSRFIGMSYIVSSKNTINQILSKIKDIHKNAKHICYAYVLKNSEGVIEESYYESTEPSGSSGKQIYSILKKMELINTLIVVIRYFGNIKLGLGLLSRSYLNATKDVINESGLIEFIERKEIRISFSPDKFNYVMNFIENNNIIIKQRNNSDFQFSLLVPVKLNINEFLHNIKIK